MTLLSHLREGRTTIDMRDYISDRHLSGSVREAHAENPVKNSGCHCE